MSDSHVRALDFCVCCNGPKARGLVICWSCHRAEKAANDGGYSQRVTDAIESLEANEMELASHHALSHHATTPAQFEQLWHAARRAAQAAAEIENLRLGDENCRGFDCGFAWVNFPGNTAFGRWAKKQGIARKSYNGGLDVWYSKLHTIPTQSISVHEAAAKAARDVLAHGLQSSLISCASRLD
jgi:hypothetical protein